MTLIALVLSLCVVALGALGIVSPRGLLNFVRRFDSWGGLYAAAAFRIVLGIVLFYSAPTSHAPELLRILGMIILGAGLITPLIGLKRFRQIVDWWSSQGLTFIRIGAALAFVFGLFLAYAVVT